LAKLWHFKIKNGIAKEAFFAHRTSHHGRPTSPAPPSRP
jgi:hypothetical protein